MLTDPNSLNDVLRDLPTRDFAPGETLLEEGKAVGLLYLLTSGKVEIVKQGVRLDTVGDRGAVFGEVSALLGQPHAATVRALEACRCRVIEDPRRFLRTQPDFGLYLAMLLAHRLNLAIGFLIDLKAESLSQARPDRQAVVDDILTGIFRMQIAREGR